MRYESPEVNVRAVWWFVLFFVITMVLIGAGLYWLFGNTPEREKRGTVATPSGPGLQLSPLHPTSEAEDEHSLRASAEQRLNSYGPSPGEPGYMHIPISKAMQMFVERK